MINRKIVILLVLLPLLSGCFTIKYATPVQAPAVLISEAKPITTKTSKRLWFAVFGLVPLGDNSISGTIAQNDLRQVRLESKFTFTDLLLSAVTGWFTIYPMTVTVEGVQQTSSKAE